jgi:hypothetical protein
MDQDIDDNAAEVEQPESGRDTPDTVSWADLTGQEKMEQFIWAFRKMKSNCNPRHDGKSWR